MFTTLWPKRQQITPKGHMCFVCKLRTGEFFSSKLRKSQRSWRFMYIKLKKQGLVSLFVVSVQIQSRDEFMG